MAATTRLGRVAEDRDRDPEPEQDDARDEQHREHDARGVD
jgi:hypothetical protein